MKHALVLILIAPTLFGAAAIRPQQLRSEYRVNPQGIDVTDPRLSWVLTAADAKARGLRQTAYRVIVASSERALAAGTGDLWDTGKVASDQSAQVVYRGKPLASGAAAFWKVQVWDQAGQPSDWSAPAQWSMGLLHPQDWQAKWIGRDEPGTTAVAHRLPARLLRKEFQAREEGPPRHRLLLRSGPLRAVPERRQGGRPRPFPRSHRLRQARSLRHLRRHQTDRRRPQRHRPDARQRPLSRPAPAGQAPATSATPRPSSAWISNTRTAAARAWSPTKPGSSPPPAPSAPTTSTTAKSTTRAWNCPAGTAPASTIPSGSRRTVVAAPAGVLAAQMAEPLRVTETLHPVSVKMLKPGVYIFDMGQNMVGWCRLRVTGPKGTPSHAAPRRNAQARWLALHRQPAHRARHRSLHAQGRRHGSLGAALHLSRLPLRRGDRLPRHSPPPRLAGRPRGPRRHGARRPISPAPTRCSTRSTTTCSGASAAIIAASPPIARSATSARAGSATAPR